MGEPPSLGDGFQLNVTAVRWMSVKTMGPSGAAGFSVGQRKIRVNKESDLILKRNRDQTKY